ncbi:MAG: caspase family protein [Deltaproteobacteria bacterium]|nr:caspase family protein [Deltaproteobacteria bacterium]
MGHSGINSISFSPDGKYILSGSSDKTAKLWDVATGRELRTFAGHTDGVTSVVFSPEGKYALSASRDGTLKLWDANTGQAIRTFKDESRNVDCVYSVAISPDGKNALAGHQNELILWNTATGEKIRSVKEGGVHAIAFSADGRYAATGGGSSPLKLWDVKTWAQIRILISPDLINSVAFSPNGRFVLASYWESSGNHRHVTLWDVKTGKAIWTLNPTSSGAAAFSPDGRYVLSFFDKRQLNLIETETGKEIAAFLVSGDDYHAGPIAFSPDGRYVISGMSGGIIKLWDIETQKEMRVFKGYMKKVASIAVSADGRRALSVSIDVLDKDYFVVWDIVAGKEVKTFPLGGNNISTHFPQAAAFSPDGKYVLSGGRNLKLWNVETGKEIKSFVKEVSTIGAVAFSPEGKQALSENVEGIKLWDVITGKEIRTFSGSKHPGSVVFSPDGRYALSGSEYNTTLKLWEVSTGKGIRTFAGKHFTSIDSIAVSPDGRYALSGSGDRTIKLWDISTGREIRQFTGHADFVYAVAFSPDGKYVSSGSADNTVKFWDISTGQEVWASRHSSSVVSIAFSPDGRYVLSGSEDGTTRFWDSATGKEIAQFISFTDGEWVVITPNGYFNASPNGAKHLNVRVGNNVYGIDQFYAKFYRPELVQLALAGKEMPQGELITDIAAQKPAPNVQILSPVTNSSVDQDNVAVTLKITDSGGGIGIVNVYLNGAQVANDTRGVIVKGKASANERILSFTIPLIKGQNEIRAVAFNGENSMESNPALISVISRAAMQKPNLYALVIGINTYRNQSISLTYAVPDAIAFAGTLQKVASPLFEKADIRTLITPEATTKEAITKAFEEVRQMVKPNDLFIFYNASHGMVDVVNGEEQYFLLTSNVRLLSSQHISKDALSHKDLVSLIGSIPAQKKLVILDTCNAGKGGKEIQIALLQQTRGLTDATAVKLLQRAVGSSVFSASADTQQALEGYKGHGLFTYVLLEGLQGKADFKKDGFITVKGLALHTEERVMTLSEEVFKRQQNPMIETGVNDFPIGRVR